MNLKKLLLVALGLGLIAGALVYALVINKPHTNIAKAPKAFEGQAVTLYKTFADDPAAASEQYVGKVLQLSGTIRDIRVTDTEGSLQLDAGDPMGGGISASMAPDQFDALRQLKVGQTVSLKGECSGYDAAEGGLLEALGANVQLTSCLLVY